MPWNNHVLLSGEGVAAIANDDCADAIVVGPTYPETVLGTTIGAEIDCPGVLDWGAVWYEVTLPYALNDLSASIAELQHRLCIQVVLYIFRIAGHVQVMLLQINMHLVLVLHQMMLHCKWVGMHVPGPGTVYVPSLCCRC